MEYRNEQDPLRALNRAVDPPASLESRVRHTLVARGLLGARVATWPRVAAAAAAVLIFAAGYVAGSMESDGAVTVDGLTRYALFLYEEDTFVATRPERELIAEYSAWAGALAQRGQLVTGEKLAARGVLLQGEADSIVVATRSAVADAGAPTGLFIIRAASDAEALRIARTCPHLRYGGRIDVLPIEDT